MIILSERFGYETPTFDYVELAFQVDCADAQNHAESRACIMSCYSIVHQQNINYKHMKQYGSPQNSPQGIHCNLLRGNRQAQMLLSIEMQVLTDYFLSGTQVISLKSASSACRITFETASIAVTILSNKK
jgi:hypothetical protein